MEEIDWQVCENPSCWQIGVELLRGGGGAQLEVGVEEASYGEVVFRDYGFSGY